MTIWLILGATAFYSLATVVMAGANERFAAQMNQISKDRFRVSVPMSLLAGLARWSVPPLWTWYAVEVSDWRFAVIAWCAPIGGVLIKLLIPRYGKPEPPQVHQVRSFR